MPPKKKFTRISSLKGIRLYNYLLKRLGEENRKQDAKQLLGISAKRKIVSEQLYPAFKAQKPSVKTVTAAIKKSVGELAPKEICNPLYLSEAYLAFVEFYEIDNHIRTVLPDCLDVRVNAGYLGKAKIFNTRNYSYHGDGVRKIIENIREELAKNESGMAYFSGIVKVKPNRKNNGNPDNYFVEYVLYINDVPEVDDSGVEYTIDRTERKKVENVKTWLAERFKVLEKEKKKRKRQQKKQSAPAKKKAVAKSEVSMRVRTAIESLKGLLKAKVITKKEFEAQRAKLLSYKKRPLK